MKPIVPLIALLLAGCAAPKYRYYFDHFQTTQRADANAIKTITSEISPLQIETADLLADAAGNIPEAVSEALTITRTKIVTKSRTVSDARIVTTESLSIQAHQPENSVKSVAHQHRPRVAVLEPVDSEPLTREAVSSGHSLKADRKELIRALKQFRKEMRDKTRLQSTSPPRDQATQKLDSELIVAISFAAVGITLSILGGLGAWFWIAGVICLGVGVYFFIDWLQNR